MDTSIFGVPLDSLLVAFVGGFLLSMAYNYLNIGVSHGNVFSVKQTIARVMLIYFLYPFAQTFLRFQHTGDTTEMRVVTIVFFTLIAGYITAMLIHRNRGTR